MLPTPDTSHVPYSRVYEPAEDSFLLLDTLSSDSETSFLHSRFSNSDKNDNTLPAAAAAAAQAPFVVEIGSGSGVVIAFATAHAEKIFGTTQVLTAAIDMNFHACAATRATAWKASAEHYKTAGLFLCAARGDLTVSLRDGSVDVLIFNPPYVPTPEMPLTVEGSSNEGGDETESRGLRGEEKTSFEEDSYLLALSYAGGKDGMETTERLLDSLPRVLSNRGCAYVLLCAQNKPEEVKKRVRAVKGRGDHDRPWKAETVATSGKKAGWEKLQIIRIWRE
ncbi:methyltransferase domain-containing protein [Xylariaceae sp. FL0255]|nr:methyltransferase domain-containing protein [Xylariaceae sp. FL0255]